jgi:hypothetical protein
MLNTHTEVRYCKTWDVSKVLDFHRKLTPVRFLSLKDLTLKMIMLIVLSSACRAQSLHLLGIDNMVKGAKCFTYLCSVSLYFLQTSTTKKEWRK